MSGGGKRILKFLGIFVGIAAIGLGGFVLLQVKAFDDSLGKVYAVPVPDVQRSSDPVVLARGKHLAESIAGCTSNGCHGPDLAGGNPIVMGPLGQITGPNITPSGNAVAYTDGELARLIQHGIKKSGAGAVFMPAQDIGWLPDAEVAAIVSWLRTVPAVAKANGPIEIKPLMKVLDRMGAIVADPARRIDHTTREAVPAPEPTAAYGRFILRNCAGCHGDHYAGGPIPGAPPEIPVPLNLTPDETGLKGWTFADFEKAMRQAVRKNGKALDPFMPVECWKNMDDIELKALWEAVLALPPAKLGSR